MQELSELGDSNDLLTLLIKHYLKGGTQREIVTVLLSRPIAQSIIKCKNAKRIGNLFGRGCKRKTIATTNRFIQRKLKLNQCKSASTATSKLKKNLGILISESTFKRRARDLRLLGWVARKKPYVSQINCVKRLMYAKEILRKPLGF